MMQTHRVLFVGLFHETHTFVEGTPGLRDFQILRGDEMLSCNVTTPSLDAFAAMFSGRRRPHAMLWNGRNNPSLFAPVGATKFNS